MLVLSRRKNESIMIGDTIEIKIIAIDSDQVKIGIEAPREIGVHRKEVYVSIQEENEQAVHSNFELSELQQWIDRKSVV